jgi:hypothetical protein
MDLHEALQTIRALADGVNPSTGEVFAEGSAYQQPETVRALAKAIEMMETAEKRERRTAGPNSFNMWTKDEEDRLCQEFQKHLDFNEMARLHKRSRGAIVARLVKLGKVAPQASPPQAA